jgi:prepilin-type N-terminal cleavage/methylation domain-containing protein
MKSNKGFTLIEIAVVLAIIAILAAILTPIVTSYIDQARVTRASADVKKIAEGILLFKRDTGVFPPYNLLATAKGGGTTDHDCLISGATPSTTNFTNGTFVCTSTAGLSQFLNVNSMGIASTNETVAAGGVINFRGPYLDGLNGTDPWANPYAVNSAQLSTTATAWAFAASAGPDGVFQTGIAQAKTGNFANGGDDITSLIR